MSLQPAAATVAPPFVKLISSYNDNDDYDTNYSSNCNTVVVVVWRNSENFHGEQMGYFLPPENFACNPYGEWEDDWGLGSVVS